MVFKQAYKNLLSSKAALKTFNNILFVVLMSRPKQTNAFLLTTPLKVNSLLGTGRQPTDKCSDKEQDIEEYKFSGILW